MTQNQLEESLDGQNNPQTVNPTPGPLEGPVAAQGLDLAVIEKRLKAATPGPWKWSQSYEHRHGEKHWCLDNPENPDRGVGDGIRRTINYYLVTLTNQPNYVVDEDIDLTDEEKTQGLKWAYRSLDSHPDFQLIANAPTDIAALVAEVRRLRAEVGHLQEAGVFNMARYNQDYELQQAGKGFKCACCGEWQPDGVGHRCVGKE